MPTVRPLTDTMPFGAFHALFLVLLYSWCNVVKHNLLMYADTLVIAIDSCLPDSSYRQPASHPNFVILAVVISRRVFYVFKFLRVQLEVFCASSLLFLLYRPCQQGVLRKLYKRQTAIDGTCAL